MDVSWPIASVIPTLDAPVLGVLARTSRPLTGREVHRLAGAGSESGVRLVLGRLTQHGIVSAEQAGKATLYTANRDHLTWPAIELLSGLRQALLDRIGRLVETWEVTPVSVAVFGSVARSDGDTESDIDVLIVHSDVDADAWEAQIDDLRDQVTTWTGNTCQIYDVSVAEYGEHLRTSEPIVNEWRQDAIVVFGLPLPRITETAVD